MNPLPSTSTDQELIARIDRWACLLEIEAYSEAFQFIDHPPETVWTPELIQKVIENYGHASPTQRVTLKGKPTDIKQRKTVTRWPINPRRCIGEVWYDLNIDGLASDLTATFWIILTQEGIILHLDNIHVM
ncbi:MAG TPA: hypothetical protein VH413_09415 [Verrucomicrobiae bacterium]|jgi:hypothetical protein|nr:hypothetical protein [Verrucomicrobiae bacterium]